MQPSSSHWRNSWYSIIEQELFYFWLESGEVYTWGDNSNGVLGFPDGKLRNTPTQLCIDEKYGRVSNITCDRDSTALTLG